MRKIIFLLIVLLTFTSLNCFAQKNAPAAKADKHPLITVGDIPPVTLINGEKKPTKTTAERIIANGKLVSNMPEYTIAGYSVSILKGTDVWGPVQIHGTIFTPEVIEQIKKTRGHNIKIIFDEIIVKDSGMPRHYSPITLTYDH